MDSRDDSASRSMAAAVLGRSGGLARAQKLTAAERKRSATKASRVAARLRHQAKLDRLAQAAASRAA